MNTKEVINHIKADHKILASYISDAISIGRDVVLMYANGKKPFKQPNWLGNTLSTYDAERDKDRILNEFNTNPGMYGYGFIVGQQRAGYHILCIDIDIDNECKELARKKYEEFFQKYNISYHLETTLTGRYHIYFAVDKVSDELKKLMELLPDCDAKKYIYTKEVDGKIEILGLDRRHVVAVYDGIINDKKPVLVIPLTVTSLEYILQSLSKFKDEVDGKIQDRFSDDVINKLITTFKLIRKHNFLNGWEIDKIVSAFCLKNQIPEDKIFQIFEQIYGETYDEKATTYIIERTKQKLDFVPGTGSVIYQAKQFLESGLLTNDEIKLVKDFLNSIKKSRKDNDDELREYLKGVEEVYQLSSIDKQSEKKGTYYVEEYFIEKEDNGDKEVWYVEIESSEKNAIFKKHVIKSGPKFVSVKVDIKRIIKEKKRLFEVVINDEFTFTPSADFKRLDDLVEEIASECADISPDFDMKRFRQYLRLKLKVFRRDPDNRKPTTVSKTTGWNDDFTHFYHYDLNNSKHELHKEHTLYKQRKAESFNQNEQHKFVFKLLEEGKLLGVLLTISSSSILLKPLNLQPFTVVITGNPGAGKTTAAKIATSLFYKSDEILLTPDTTKTGLELKLASLNSLSFVVDEGALAEDEELLKRLIFGVASKKGRTRGKKDLSVETKDILSNVFWTSEVSDLDDIKRAGAFRRVIHLTVKSWQDFTKIYDIDNTPQTPNELYSGCGVDYIKYAIENLAKIKDLFNKETKTFAIKYKEITGIARTVHAGIILLEEFYKAYYNLEQTFTFKELRKEVDKLLEDVRKTFIAAKDDVGFTLQQYLFKNEHRFLLFKKEENSNRYIVVHRPTVEKLGEYDITQGIYYITSDAFKTIAKELEKESTLLKDELVKAGIMEKEGFTYVSKANQSKVWAYKIKFPTNPLPPPEQQQPPPEQTQPETQPEISIDEIDDAIVDAFSKTTYDSKETPEKPATTKTVSSVDEQTKTNTDIDYVKEIMKFILSVESEEKRISLRGLTYEDVMKKIDYKPPNDNKLKELLMKFFFNQDESKNYRFRNKCILLDYLPTGNMYYKDKVEEASIILKEFTKEDVDIWLKVALIRYGINLKWIKNELTYMNEEKVKGSELIKKFPALKFHGLDPF